MSVYDERPWLALYDEGVPADPVLPHETGLAMFDAAVARDPRAPLLHYLDTTLTTGQVDELAAGLAVGLAEEYGVGRGDRVMVQVQNMPAFVLAMIATWRLGAVLVPINPMFRDSELDKLMADAAPRVLIQLESLVPVLASVTSRHDTAVISASELDFVTSWPEDIFPGVRRARVEGVRDLGELIGSHTGKRPPTVETAGDDLAFLVYTSGTTGPPKGAMNLHRGVVFSSENYRNWCKLTDQDVCLGIAPLFHVTGLIAHIGVAFLLPMPLVLGYRFHPVMMARLIEKYRASWVMGSITAYIALLNEPTIDSFDLSSLSKLWSGGQAVSPTTVEELEKRFGAYVHNLYGLTEVTSESHAVPAGRRAPVDPDSGALSVGPPVSGYVVRVVDEHGNDVPVGEVGELVMESDSVVPGYWRKPAESEKAIPGGRLFTGDVGFMDTEGWFYIVDRKKDLIIASGFKIWPREVEDVLYQHPAVKEAAVVGVPDSYRGETVAAFVSLKPGAHAEPGELVAFCKQRLAAFKYPRTVEILDEIPKNPNGKILRRSLRGRVATVETRRA
ncbi:long-chain fatty acid--CoA ligase [Amycolatopsis rhizosphaerae]|uniref:Long-chain fatty acid--CoA ligase n=1 Tax=Amycolatopsis rhizosphaerae TaxID=2053003 RepID=A0A558BGC7_9PSEU|nr:AMP-binding protein [Amycolatopsis rhizosphaerae]TVT35557.1 long-chain fatty acid--CoA ligase [Amycolatopsis rhizosphaerae]